LRFSITGCSFGAFGVKSRRMMFFVYSLIGALAASILACIPALHIYNVVGLLLLLGAGASALVGPEELSALMIGLITGYAMLNTLPSIFLSAPDDSTIFVVLPGQKYLLQWTQ
jgi:putative membrane protein